MTPAIRRPSRSRGGARSTQPDSKAQEDYGAPHMKNLSLQPNDFLKHGKPYDDPPFL
jgi:hypothetical protein